MEKKGGAGIIIAVILGILIIGGGVSYFVFSGGEDSRDTDLIESSTTEVSGSVKYADDGSCSNSKYSVDKNGRLTKESQEKLESAIIEKGDSALEGITNLDCLKYLGDGIAHTPLKDISLLANLKNLTYLGLTGTSISDISPLSELKNLDTIDLDSTNISDISPLSELKNLEILRIRKSFISKEDCLSLRASSPNADPFYWDCKDSNVIEYSCFNEEYSTYVEDFVGRLSGESIIVLTEESEKKLRKAITENGGSALGGISDLTCLESLYLSSSGQIDGSDLDISAIGSLKNLKGFYLRETCISDISVLYELKNLEEVDLLSSACGILGEDCLDLIQKLPNAKVYCFDKDIPALNIDL